MNFQSVPPYRPTLRQLAHRAGYTSLSALADAADVSEWQLARLEWGLWAQIPVGVMVKLAIALQMPVGQVITALGAPASLPSPPPETEPSPSMRQQLQTLEREYQRLQAQLTTQAATLHSRFQQQVLDTLEPWLLQWPTAAAHAQQNPAFPAQKLLPLTRPIATLLSQWQIEAIASVGDRVPFDPRWHEFMGEGAVPPASTVVVVRYAGYRRGETLLYRAKVSLPPDAPS
ncbi:MAG: hypothetical protein VKJ27_00465 [Synechocystis sp.]|nr:hypothetical protein [Synechocystis sp.]